MRFRTRIMLYVMLLLALTFGLGGSILIFESFNTALESGREASLASYRMAVGTLSIVAETGSWSGGEEIIHTLSQLDSQEGAGWSALRLSDGAKPIHESGADARFLRDIVKTNEVGQCITLLWDEPEKGHFLQVSGQLKVKENILTLDMLFDMSPIYKERDTQLRIYKWVFLVAVLLGTEMSWLMAGFITKPLEKLSATTKKVAAGDLSCRADEDYGGEIGSLATDFNAMTQKLEENIGQLRETMRRQEEFMGSFAHELKTPMTSIIGYADLLRGRRLSENEQREAANYVFNEARRLESLSLKLLDLLVLKKKDFALRPCSPKQMLISVRRTIAPVLRGRDIELLCHADDGLLYLEPDLTKSLLINLIDNARKAMDGPGKIAVCMKLCPGGVEIKVIDNGRGMEPEEIARITEAFYRVDKSRSREQGGAGLGLSLTREIVELHNGDMRFESVPGRGTRVTVFLKGDEVSEEEDE